MMKSLFRSTVPKALVLTAMGVVLTGCGSSSKSSEEEGVPAGMQWLAAYYSEDMFGIDPAELETGALNGSGKRISQPVAWGPEGAAFDADGNLWVSDCNLSTIRVFSPAAQAAGGQPVPLLKLTGGDIFGPVGIAFDLAGSLWVADHDDGYYAASLASSSVSDGDLIIPLSQDWPYAVAFDASGRLYVSSWSSGTIYRYDNAAGIASGSTAPGLPMAASPPSARSRFRRPTSIPD
jgi:DNA-binding beta-propeller fold protein YncE